jgi:hypothetical protein
LRYAIPSRYGIPFRKICIENMEFFDNQLYHVYNRGNNQQQIFFTKAKCVSEGSKSYDLTCFNYIHQNPMKAKLVEKMEDWPYSSFRDYCGIRNGTLCNKELAVKLLGLNMEVFYEDSYRIINADDLNMLF